MSQTQKTDVAVVGGGIVGLAVARAAAQRGQSVTVFERNSQAIGASIRNFGLIWPIGQPPGATRQRALRSREVWLDLSQKAGFWANKNGSLHLAYHADEQSVLEEFYESSGQKDYPLEWWSPATTATRATAVKAAGLRGGLFSATELTVDPREALTVLPRYLSETQNINFHYNSAVNRIDGQRLFVGRQAYEAERIFVCSGSDFETLYPEEFAAADITKCQLQMMRTAPQPPNWTLGPTLCGGLTLRHYAAFQDCPSLPLLDKRYDQENPNFKRWGIHVMLAQNGRGELVIGDSHAYGTTLLPFSYQKIDDTIMNYLHTFSQAPNLQIAERWTGIYPKLPGQTEWVVEVSDAVTIVNALGGAGMTLSFGLAEELIAGKLATAPVTV